MTMWPNYHIIKVVSIGCLTAFYVVLVPLFSFGLRFSSDGVYFESTINVYDMDFCTTTYRENTFLTKKFSGSAHFGPFGSNPLLQMAHINYPDSHHSQGGLEICHTNFTST